MKDIWDIAISGKKVVLVPFCKKFLAKYHVWMEDPYIQEMTCTEPFATLEEEENHRLTWYTNPEKVTFIIVKRNSDSSEPHLGTNSTSLADDNLSHDDEIDDEVHRIAGDVNLFFSTCDGVKIAEINIMIAEAMYRGQGLAKEAVLLAMSYAVTDLAIQQFQVKISSTNTASLHLFKRLGFEEINYDEAFKEHELQYHMNDETLSTLHDHSKHAIRYKYIHQLDD